MQKLRIIVGGFIGILPAGGITWDYVQYPLGFSLLGHDVYYIEDTRLYPIYQKAGSQWDDCSSSVKHLQKVMSYFGYKDKWAYRDEASGKCFGLSDEEIKKICASADIFINISCSTFLRDEYLRIPIRVLVDSDPMFTQIQYSSLQMFTPGMPGNLKQMANAHTHHFTFGENIGAPDCRIPDCDLQWHTTRQPICLTYWQNQPHITPLEMSFTTLMNWTAGKILEYNNDSWGQKDIEFKKYLELPQLVKNASFAAIVNQTGGTDPTFSKEEIERKDWKILDPDRCSSWMEYQDFIQNSFGEFSVAKETYVKANTGWFSGRSACYLAAGRPVVTQDTGWSKYIPSGFGLFAFSDLIEAADSIKKIVAEPARQMVAARAIAEDYFDSNKVLKSFLNQIN